MESDSGLLRWLKVPFLYSALQAVTVAPRRANDITLDINPDCVAYAQRTYGARGTFVWANCNRFAGICDSHE